MAFQSGARTTYENTNDHKESLKDGLNFLNPRKDGVAFLKRLGMSGFTVNNTKTEWTEVELAPRSEIVSLNTSATTLTVGDAYQYQVNDLLKIEDEILRVTAIASGTTLTVVRGYGDTSDPGSNYTSVTMRNLGSADPENSEAPASITDAPSKLYNYVQTFTRAVELSNDEIARASTEGNPLTGNIKRRYIELVRQLSTSIFYQQRYEDTSNKLRSMGGLDFFLSTNVTDVSGALTIAAIDAEIKAIVDAGGTPSVIVVNTTQKQKLDALDADLVRTGKKDAGSKTGGNPRVMTWQSGILDYELDIVVDHSINQDELWILSEDMIEVGYLSGNGVNGAFSIEDATTPGQDGKHKVIRGKYTMRVMQEKAHAKLYGLTT